MRTKLLTTEELFHETTEELGQEESVKNTRTLDPELLHKMNAYLRLSSI